MVAIRYLTNIKNSSRLIVCIMPLRFHLQYTFIGYGSYLF